MVIKTNPEFTSRANDNSTAQFRPELFSPVSADRHADLLIETGLIPKGMPLKSGYALIISSFELGQAGKYSPDELIKSGQIKKVELTDKGESRRPEEVKHITLRKSSQAKPGEKEANYRIKADGTIEQLRHPDKKASQNDDEIIVEVDDGGASEIKALSEKQKAAIRQMIGYLESRYLAAGLNPIIPDDLLHALKDEPQIPPPVVRTRSSGYNGHRIGTPRTEMPAMPSGGYQPQAVGRSPRTDIAESRAFQEMGPTPEIKTPEALKGFVDRVVAAVSANEGGFTSINWNDNGAGISVGKAGFNQKVGELPSLLRRFHERDPQKFNQIFGVNAQNMLNENFVRHTPISRGSELGNAMAEALREPQFQQVQMEMMREKVVKGIKLAHKYGHTSELFVAEVTDMGNQFGWGGVEACLRKSNVANIADERSAILALQQVGQRKWAGRVHRDTRLANKFSPDLPATT